MEKVANFMVLIVYVILIFSCSIYPLFKIVLEIVQTAFRSCSRKIKKKKQRKKYYLYEEPAPNIEPKVADISNARVENASTDNYLPIQDFLLSLSEKSLINDTERKYLLRYKNLASLIDEEKKKLQDFSVSIPCEQDETIDILKRIDEYTEQLRILESIYPLHDVLKRENCYQSVPKQKTEAIRQPAFENHLNDILNRKTIGDYFEPRCRTMLNAARTPSMAHNSQPRKKHNEKLINLIFFLIIGVIVCAAVVFSQQEDQYTTKLPAIKFSETLPPLVPETFPSFAESRSDHVTPPVTDPPTTSPAVTEPTETKPPQNQEKQLTVYYTRTGECYHYENPCGRGTYYPISLDKAKQRGLRPCGKCVLH